MEKLLVYLCGVCLAFWPTGVWYLRRITDGSDEPWGLLALLAALALALRQKIPAPKPWQIGSISLLLLVNFATYPWAMPLAQAVMATSALALLLARARGAVALWLLLLLSLPVVPTLQFFLGYPMRLLAAKTSAGLLCASGFPVIQEGTALRWAGESVLVDAPCSGLKMVWAAAFLASTLAGWRQLGSIRTLLLLGATSGIVIAANIARSTLLFFKEAQIVHLPDWTHAGIGLAVFALAAMAILALAARLEGGAPRRRDRRPVGGLCEAAGREPSFAPGGLEEATYNDVRLRRFHPLRSFYPYR
jgi:exosortase/archaeosortase family protein